MGELLSKLAYYGGKPSVTREDSYNISVDAIKRNVTDKTKMVVVTHMRGLPVDMEPLSKFCKSRGIFLVEDASHAIGATYQGIHVGNW